MATDVLLSTLDEITLHIPADQFPEHGELAGLGDDDHPQYLTAARGDARYVDAAPGLLDTLNELAAALADDPNFATTMATALATKALDAAVVHLAGVEILTGAKTFTDAALFKSGRPWVDVSTLATSGDGTAGNPWTGWAAVLNAYATPTVFFFSAGYYAPEVVVTVPSGCKLWAHAETAIIKLPNGADRNIIYVPLVSTDVEITGLKIDGNRANQTLNSNGIANYGQRVKIHGNHVVSCNGYNIVSWLGSGDAAVYDNVSEDARDEGIEFMGVARGGAVNNTVRTAGKNGIFVWSNAAGGGDCYGITILGNRVYNSANLTANYAGIKVDDASHDVIVVANQVHGGGAGGGARGISVGSSVGDIYNVVVDSNSVFSPSSHGIQVQDHVLNLLIRGNTVRGSVAGDGIRVSGSVARIKMKDNLLTGNNGYGLRIDSGDDMSFFDNIYQGNGSGTFTVNAAATNISRGPDGTGMRGLKSGLYYTSEWFTSGDTTAALVLNQETVIPFTVNEDGSCDRISLEITTAVATALVRLGIRRDVMTPGGGYPETLVIDAGTIDGSTLGIKEIVIAQRLVPGRYYLTATPQTAVPTVRGRGMSNQFTGQTTGGNVNNTTYIQTGITGALPAAFSATVSIIQTSVLPKIMLRRV